MLARPRGDKQVEAEAQAMQAAKAQAPPGARPWLVMALALGLALALVPRAQAQMSQPLEGRNVDPVTAGVWKKGANGDNSRVPVYFSVSLDKIQEVDEKGYTYSAVYTVVMTWHDPRLQQMANLMSFMSADVQAARAQALQNCSNWAVLTGTTSNPDCIAAMAAATSGCDNPCFMGNGYACCDGVWVPGFYITNLLTISQDAVVHDKIWLYGTTVGQKDQSLTDTVYRVVKIQCTFSNGYAFQRFPFDSQVLQFLVSPSPPANHFIVPSMRGTSILGPYGFVFQMNSMPFGEPSTDPISMGQFADKQVTGWQFKGSNPVEISCNTASPASSPPPGWAESVGLAPSDPQSWALTNRTSPLINVSSNSTQPGMVCAVCINIERISSYYVINNIIPVLVNGLLAFTVVFARPGDLDIRLSTLVTLFLALVAVQFVISDQLPRTSYATAFSALVLTSYALIVVLILESLFVFYLSVLEENYNRKMAALEKRALTLSKRGMVDMPIEEEDEDANVDGRPASPTELSETEENGEKRSKAFPSSSSVQAAHPIFQPFRYTEETVMRFVRDDDSAFHFAVLVDNLSLLLLGIGYATASVLVFVLLKPDPWPECRYAV